VLRAGSHFEIPDKHGTIREHMAWIHRGWSLVARVLSFIAAVASMVSVPFTLKPFAEWGPTGYAMLVVSAALLVIGVVLEIRAACSTTVFAKDNQRGIRDYMFRWIRHGGPVAIWTRDHTWVDDDEMRRLLIEKAQRRELTLCVPRATTFSDELGAAGADVVLHGLSDPAVRFTITQFNKDTFSVALARPGSQFHVIEEYANSDPSAALARDLVLLARSRQGIS
jgi:hypothetical protein